MKNIAILDRDGTICEELGYITSGEEEAKILPCSAEAIKWLNDHGWLVVGASNQSGVSRGYTTEEWVERVNRRMMDTLAAQGAKIEKVYFCPHHPLESCECRKPKPGMIQQILKDFQADVSHCVMVGDKDCDVEMGKAVGVTTVLVLTGYGKETQAQCVGPLAPDFAANDLLDAAKWIVEHHGARKPAGARG